MSMESLASHWFWPQDAYFVARGRLDLKMPNQALGILGFRKLPSISPSGGKIHTPGEVAEWSNAADSKSVDGSNHPRVRIPPSPLSFSHLSVSAVISSKLIKSALDSKITGFA